MINYQQMKVKVAVAQMDCRMGEIRANLETIKKLAKSISKQNPEIICFPELATTGYSLNRNWVKYAEPIPGKTTDELCSIASELGSYLICGIDELDSQSGKIYDSAILISPNGKLRGTYRKVHLWDKERKFFVHGSNFPTFQTKFGKIGIGICYDIEFPEAARALAINGAKILFFPSAEMSPMENHVDTYAKSRSAENCCFVAFCNRTGTEYKTHFFGRSQIVSPDCKVLTRSTVRSPVAIAEVDYSLLESLRPKLPYLSQRVTEAYSDS
jgi:predicted amidohydrolase